MITLKVDMANMLHVSNISINLDIYISPIFTLLDPHADQLFLVADVTTKLWNSAFYCFYYCIVLLSFKLVSIVQYFGQLLFFYVLYKKIWTGCWMHSVY